MTCNIYILSLPIICIFLKHIVKHILNQHLELNSIYIFLLHRMEILACYYFPLLPPFQTASLSIPCDHLKFYLVLIRKYIYFRFINKRCWFPYLPLLLIPHVFFLDSFALLHQWVLKQRLYHTPF